MERRSWLEERFSEFYVEVERQRRLVQSGRWARAKEAYTAEAPEGESLGPNPVWDAIARTLRRQEAEASRAGAAAQYYRDAEYAMVALADEIFLNLDWTGREEWEDRLLETEFFNSQIAGEKLFDNVDAILGRRDPGEAEVARIYYLALRLGFQGRYRGDDLSAIEKVQRNLLGRFYKQDRVERVSPQAYEHTQTGVEGLLIPSARKAVAVLAIVVVAFVGVSYLLYSASVSDIDRSTGTVQENLGGYVIQEEATRGGGE